MNLHMPEGALNIDHCIPVGGDEELQVAEGPVQDTVREKSDQDDGKEDGPEVKPLQISQSAEQQGGRSTRAL